MSQVEVDDRPTPAAPWTETAAGAAPPGFNDLLRNWENKLPGITARIQEARDNKSSPGTLDWLNGREVRYSGWREEPQLRRGGVIHALLQALQETYPERNSGIRRDAAQIVAAALTSPLDHYLQESATNPGAPGSMEEILAKIHLLDASQAKRDLTHTLQHSEEEATARALETLGQIACDSRCRRETAEKGECFHEIVGAEHEQTGREFILKDWGRKDSPAWEKTVTPALEAVWDALDYYTEDWTDDGRFEIIHTAAEIMAKPAYDRATMLGAWHPGVSAITRARRKAVVDDPSGFAAMLRHVSVIMQKRCAETMSALSQAMEKDRYTEAEQAVTELARIRKAAREAECRGRTPKATPEEIQRELGAPIELQHHADLAEALEERNEMLVQKFARAALEEESSSPGDMDAATQAAIDALAKKLPQGDLERLVETLHTRGATVTPTRLPRRRRKTDAPADRPSGDGRAQ